MNFIYHLITPKNVKTLARLKHVKCYGFGKDIHRGFICCSTYDQVWKTYLEKYSHHQKMKVLCLDVLSFPKDTVKWELRIKKNGEQVMYPHIHGSFTWNQSVVNVRNVKCFKEF